MARIEVNRKGVRELLTAPGVVSVVTSIAGRIASAAGPGMETRPAETGGNRARAAVVTATFEARYAEATTRALTRAVGSGRI